MRIRSLRYSGPVIAVGAAAAFWLLSHGGALSFASVRGYAEAVDHALGPLQGGRIATVEVRLGQKVHAGDVLARLDTRALEIQLQVAESQLAESQAQLVAEHSIQAVQVLRAEISVLKLRATQSKNRAELAEVTQQLSRLEKLADERLVQARDVEQSRLRKAGLSASVATLDEANDRGEAVARSALPPGAAGAQVQKRLAPFRELVHTREASVRAARLALEEAVIRAKADGTVAMILHRPGDVVPAATEVVRVASAREGHVVCWLPERMVTRVAVGQKAVVRGAGAFERSFGARVVEVSPEIEELPPRARTSLTVPAWGRRVVLESWPPRPLVLGETLHVRL